MSNKVKDFIAYLSASVLAIVVLSVVFALLVGLFNPVVDNDKIFSILGPAFNMVVGCFISLFSVRSGRSSDPVPPKEGVKKDE